MEPFQSIAAYHEALAQGATTILQTTEAYLNRIQQYRAMNAYIEVFAQEALAQAAQQDQLIQIGASLLPLQGVIVGIKDVLHYEGHAVTAASKMLAGYKANYHATAVERLLAAGAIIIGRQNCDEFAMGSSNEHSAYGPAQHPQYSDRVPGGSSGGSAAAVAANLCMVSLGSDTGGSVRQPADFCGIVGLKPSYGRVSRHGLIAYASSFDQIGVFSKTVEDAALVLQCIAGEDEWDSTVASWPVPNYVQDLQQFDLYQKRKIAYIGSAVHHPSLDPEIKASFLGACSAFQALGNTVEEVNLPLLDYIVPTYYILTTAEASSNLSRYDGVRYGHRSQAPMNELSDLYIKSRSEGFGKEVQRRILLGTYVLSSGYYDAYFSKAQQVRRLLLDQVTDILKKYDAIWMPTVPSPAWKMGEKSENPTDMYLADIFTVLANLTGMPAISLPLFQHSSGLPFGLQVMTNRGEELSLLSISRQLMANVQK